MGKKAKQKEQYLALALAIIQLSYSFFQVKKGMSKNAHISS